MHKRNLAAGADLWSAESAEPRVQTHEGEERTAIVLTGELDIRASLRFRGALMSAERRGPALIVIDLRELAFMDSSGLAELVRGSPRAREERRRMVLVTGSEPIDRMLAVSGVTQILETTADPATLDA